MTSPSPDDRPDPSPRAAPSAPPLAPPAAGALSELLAGWLPHQRWFAAKGRDVTSLEVATATWGVTTDGATLLQALATVAFGDGGQAHVYQVPLLISRDERDDMGHALVGHAGPLLCYDALHDREGTRLVLQLIREGAAVGPYRFVTAPDAGQLPDIGGAALGTEQSNTSVRYGDDLLLKIFRRVAPGTNPDLEVTRALAAGGCTAIAPPLGWLEGPVDGELATLGLLQPFLRSGTEGWKLAVASVRDLFAEGDLHAHEVGGDFAGESERLGQATAEVHAVLARVLPSGTAGAQDSVATAALMHRRLDEALAVVEQLRPFAPALRSAYDAVATRTADVAIQRVHGDYHLGQVLRTDHGWILLDFEGEPARSLPERTALMSPLRDVAGMLRSFDYAARSLLADRASTGGESTGLAYRAHEWAERNRTAFCDGYASAAGSDPRDELTLLRAFELDKAVYEVVYEARHRPTWLPIPLGAVERLAGGTG